MSIRLNKSHGLFSFFFYFSNFFIREDSKPSVPRLVRYRDTVYSFSVPDSIQSIKDNSFIILNVSDKLDINLLREKCLKYGHVVHLKTDSIKRARIFSDLGLDKLEGIFYYKNKSEIYDALDFRPHLKTQIHPWDIFILSKILEFKSQVKKLGTCNFEMDFISMTFRLIKVFISS
ncbi:uncharacterized protein VNE69_07115 [Vairimorpha necatrix]|uniref:Uncharacterized protein n=1 Tax=Vairimorpha necatrix TaxID=6039 RepID=A0AAX4JDH4_9MICR